MEKYLETLPSQILDECVAYILGASPSLRLAFLSSLGSVLHASCVRVLFGSLSLPDDTRVFEPGTIVSPILANPPRYAYYTKSLVIKDSSNDSIRHPVDALRLFSVLEACINLEELFWQSSFPPPDGIGEVLSAHNAKLLRFSCLQSPAYEQTRSYLPRWDAPSLALLSGLSLTSLHVSRLSQIGAQAFSNLLSNMSEYPSLEELGVDFVWLDDSLCRKIVEAGRRLRKLSLGTSGTKLSDRGIVAILEGCDTLESLTLQEVQGRLSRSLWSKPEHFPSALKNLTVIVNETGPHHSWTTDHLLSLHALPLDSLHSLTIIRLEPIPHLEEGVPIFDTPIDDVISLRPVPQDFVDKMKHAKELTTFECDWWSWNIANLKVVLESCSQLQTIRICFDAPFPKLLSLTSTFSSLFQLGSLHVSVNPMQAPGRIPIPLLPFAATPSLPTPTESPVLRGKSVLPQLLDFDHMQTQTCPPSENGGDPSMPHLRDVKRFARKCPRLATLEWYGKFGRGLWSITRPSTVSKISMSVTVEYHPPTVSEVVWQNILRQQEAKDSSKNTSAHLEVERVGRAWTGPTAEALAAERRTAEDSTSFEREKNGRSRRAKSISIPASDLSQLSTPVGGSLSMFSPLTPPPSENSISSLLTPVTALKREPRQRVPSEPSQYPELVATRARGATMSAQQEPQDRHSSSSSSRGSKFGRGRGARGGKTGKKSTQEADQGANTLSGGRGGSRGRRPPR